VTRREGELIVLAVVALFFIALAAPGFDIPTGGPIR